MITVLRQYFSYTFNNSCVYKISHTLTLRIEGEKSPVLLLPIEKYRADLEVRDSEGNHLIIIPDAEFESKFTDAKMSEFSDIFLSDISQDGTGAPRPEFGGMLEGLRVVAILLPRHDDEAYYERITIRWTAQIENRKLIGKYTQYVEIPIRLPRYTRLGATSALYVSVKTNQKYVFLREPVVVDLLTDARPEMLDLISDERNRAYRFPPTDCSQLIGIFVELGLPPMVTYWASYGGIAALYVPPFLLAVSLYLGHVPDFSFEIIAGIMAFVIGLRVIVSRDVTLMVNYNQLHIKLLVWAALVLFALVLLNANPNSLKIVSDGIAGAISAFWGLTQNSSLHISTTSN